MKFLKKAMFKPVSNQISFPKKEEEILTFWKEEGIFKKSIEQRPVENSYVFYDGPPFATGLPHYGHILTSIVKDVIPRFQTMKGKRVERRFGWDCHGLPVEYEVEQELGLKSKKEIKEFGEGKFNEACHSIVMRYTAEWEKTITRIARWVDFENDYRTMELPYMESVWWVFKSLFDKGLIYEGHKVINYCYRCETPLSNFEARLDDSYRERQDPTVTARFKINEWDNTYMLAWTTTPWTLPSNMALCVGPELEYIKLEHKGKNLVLAKEVMTEFFDPLDITIKETIKGKDLVGLTYTPLFPYYEDAKEEGAFRIVSDAFVAVDEGTGIVHMAPGSGEIDYEICQREGIPYRISILDDGTFKEEIADFKGMNVHEANRQIIRHLNEKDLVEKDQTYVHNYPHCWRCDTPLIFTAISSWFVKVTEIKDKMVKNNQEIHWVPDWIKDKVFGKWLENARDWAISRNRFWGAPLPVWKCDCDTPRVFGSAEELSKATGEDVSDLHKHKIDHLTITCETCGKEAKRVEEVLDCWFESGSMPFAQVHYPFERREWFEKNFPADFIVEYIAQTRGWFYTLMILSTALFDKPPFLNVICHGVVLADDGRKMSKRLKNYTEPELLVDKFGADAMRLYMMSSTVLKAEDWRFSDRGVDEIVKSFLLPLWNAYSFFVTYANIDGWDKASREKPTSKLDQWILSELHVLNKEVDTALEAYDLQNATRPLIAFVDSLTNWYIRRSRRRFWKSENDADKNSAYSTLYTVLTEFAQIIAPVTPFISEEIYRNLTGEESVHLADWPKADDGVINEALNEEIAAVRKVVTLGHAVRARAKLKVRQPLAGVTVKSEKSLSKEELDVIAEELNVKTVDVKEDVSEFAERVIKPNAKILGPKFGGVVQQIIKEAKAGNVEELDAGVKVAGNDEWVLSEEEFDVAYQTKEGFEAAADKGTVIALDTTITDELKKEGLARELIRQVQELRKEAEYNVEDRITVKLFTEDVAIKEAISSFADYIKEETLSTEILADDGSSVDKEKHVDLEGSNVLVGVKKA